MRGEIKLSEQKWNRMKGYIESIKNSMNFDEMTATDVIETILQRMDYEETIDDEGNCIY